VQVRSKYGRAQEAGIPLPDWPAWQCRYGRYGPGTHECILAREAKQVRKYGGLSRGRLPYLVPRRTLAAAPPRSGGVRGEPLAVHQMRAGGLGDSGRMPAASSVFRVTAKAKSTPPAALGGAGKRLWRAIVKDVAADWELDAKDLATLTEAARIADTLAALEKAIKRQGAVVEGSTGQPRVHPAIGEANKLRETQHRLLRSIELEAPAADANARSRFASEAARARWSPKEAAANG
jgi:phage terminase small subunit